MKTFSLSIVSLFLACLSSPVWAWDAATAGKVHTIDVAPGHNDGSRVTLLGVPALSGNVHTWAYLNEADSNYKTFVSTSLLAKATGATVTIYANKETVSGNGYCQVGHVSMN
jgi:hypothetical protein